MTIVAILERTGKLEIVPFRRARSLQQTHTPYCGYPQKHALDPAKIMLIIDPFMPDEGYYEFFLSDVDHVERLPSLSTQDGRAITMVRLWVRNQALGLRVFPFAVSRQSPGQ